MTLCPRPALAYVQHVGAAVPACADHARLGRVVELLAAERGPRLCAFELELSTSTPANTSAFELVIVEAIPRCPCGSSAIVLCEPCTVRMLSLPPPALRRAIARLRRAA